MNYEFQLHLDASLLNFKFKHPSYITVRYTVVLDTAVVYEVVIPFHLLPVLNNPVEVHKQAEAAATHNLLSRTQKPAPQDNNVHPVFNNILNNFIPNSNP